MEELLDLLLLKKNGKFYDQLDDVWDLQPFKGGKFTNSFSTQIWNKIFPGKIIKSDGYTVTRKTNKPPKFFKIIDNMEMGKIMGGKPFKMRTDVPME